MIEIPFQIQSRSGWPIRGDVRRIRGPQVGMVVVSHGFKGFKDWGMFPYLARRLAEQSLTAITFNFSGNGVGDNLEQFTELDRFRENSLTREVEDLETVIEAAFKGELDGVEAGIGAASILGHSRGGLVSIIVAERNDRVGRLVTWAGVGNLAARYPEPVRREWRQAGVQKVVNARTGQVLEMGLGALDDLETHLDDYEPAPIMARTAKPALIVHGTEDEAVPYAEAEALHRAAPDVSKLAAVAGGGHTFGAVHPFAGTTPHLEAAIEATLEFLGEPE